jgi:hypothetical protein
MAFLGTLTVDVLNPLVDLKVRALVFDLVIGWQLRFGTGHTGPH